MRTYTLTIGRPVYLSDKTTKISDYTSDAGKNAILVRDLNIEFDIKKDNSKHPNKGYVTVYNLSQDNINFLSSNQGEKLAVILTAGYDNDERQIFSGTVEYMEDTWDGPTRKTKFIFGDASANIYRSTSARSYKAGTPINTVLNDLVSDLNLPKGRIIPFSAETLSHSMAFNGNTAENLDKLASNTGSTFSVQDGAVYWTKQGTRLKEVVFEVSELTGMKGSPTPKNPAPFKKKKKKKDAKKEDAGLIVTSLLNGAILPETTIHLTSRSYTGFYKVVYLSHKGEYEGNNWDTEMGLANVTGVTQVP